MQLAKRHSDKSITEVPTKEPEEEVVSDFAANDVTATKSSIKEKKSLTPMDPKTLNEKQCRLLKRMLEREIATHHKVIYVTLKRPNEDPIKSIRNVWGIQIIRMVEEQEQQDEDEKEKEAKQKAEKFVVSEVIASSPAACAGVQAGDVIDQVFGAPFSSSRQLHEIMKHCLQNLRLTLLRKCNELHHENNDGDGVKLDSRVSPNNPKKQHNTGRASSTSSLDNASTHSITSRVIDDDFIIPLSRSNIIYEQKFFHSQRSRVISKGNEYHDAMNIIRENDSTATDFEKLPTEETDNKDTSQNYLPAMTLNLTRKYKRQMENYPYPSHDVDENDTKIQKIEITHRCLKSSIGSPIQDLKEPPKTPIKCDKDDFKPNLGKDEMINIDDERQTTELANSSNRESKKAPLSPLNEAYLSGSNEIVENKLRYNDLISPTPPKVINQSGSTEMLTSNSNPSTDKICIPEIGDSQVDFADETKVSSNLDHGHSPVKIEYSKSTSNIQQRRKLHDINDDALKRLWPDAFPFYKKVLKWSPPVRVFNKKGKVDFSGSIDSIFDVKSKNIFLNPIPDQFKDSIHMLNCFVPYVLREAKEQIHADYLLNSKNDKTWNRNVYKMCIDSYHPLEPRSSSFQRLYELNLHYDYKDKNLKDEIVPYLGDLFAISSNAWSSSILGVFGVTDPVSSHDNRLDAEAFQLRLIICVSEKDCVGTGWLPYELLPKTTLSGALQRHSLDVMFISSVCTSVREYEGIKGISSVSPHIKKTLFSKLPDNLQGDDDRVKANGPSSLKKPQMLSSNIWNTLSQGLNSLQLASIEQLITGKVKNNFMLLQGPPGTGKTKTVTGLVTALINGGCPSGGSVSLGIRVKIGGSMSKQRSHNICNSEQGRKTRILVCAPSNTAVDDLAWRIHNTCIGPDGKVGTLKMVRLGNLQSGEKAFTSKTRKTKNAWSANRNDKESFLRRIHIDSIVGDRSLVMDKRRVILDCDIVCTTVSGAGSKALIEASHHGENKSKTSEFDVVIIDEACQASEQASLIPLKYNPQVVVLVGDPQQLPVFVRIKDNSEHNFGRSLFSRLRTNGFPVQMLRFQYRMHPIIADFSSKQFYDGKLITSDCVKNRCPAPWYKHQCFPPFLIWNLQGSMQRSKGGGIFNKEEDSFIVKRLLELFLSRFCQNQQNQLNIGIISFYNEQVSNLQRIVQALNFDKLPNISIQVSTVDGFQGSEKDIIILSCVRSRLHNGGDRGVGFLKDYRRMNVALTRARLSLWIVGNCDVLARDRVWKALLDSAQHKNLISSIDEFDHLSNKCDRATYRLDRHRSEPQSDTFNDSLYHSKKHNKLAPRSEPYNASTAASTYESNFYKHSRHESYMHIRSAPKSDLYNHSSHQFNVDDHSSHELYIRNRWVPPLDSHSTCYSESYKRSTAPSDGSNYCEVDRYVEYERDNEGPKIRVRWRNGEETLEPLSQIMDDDPKGLVEWVKLQGLENHPDFTKSMSKMRHFPVVHQEKRARSYRDI